MPFDFATVAESPEPAPAPAPAPRPRFDFSTIAEPLADDDMTDEQWRHAHPLSAHDQAVNAAAPPLRAMTDQGLLAGIGQGVLNKGAATARGLGSILDLITQHLPDYVTSPEDKERSATQAELLSQLTAEQRQAWQDSNQAHQEAQANAETVAGFAPLLAGPPGVAAVAADAGGNRAQDVREQGGSDAKAAAAGGIEALLMGAVPELSKLGAPLLRPLGDTAGKVVTELTGSAGAGERAAGAAAGAAEQSAVGAGFPAADAAISAGSGDPERAKAELAGAPGSAEGFGALGAILGLLTGRHAPAVRPPERAPEPAAEAPAVAPSAPRAAAPAPEPTPAAPDQAAAIVQEAAHDLSAQAQDAAQRPAGQPAAGREAQGQEGGGLPQAQEGLAGLTPEERAARIAKVQGDRAARSGAADRVPTAGDPGAGEPTPEAQAEAARAGVTIDRTKDVPLAGGISQDGKTVYIDKDMPQKVTLPDGKVADVDASLVKHETAEKPAIDANTAAGHEPVKAYEDAHNHTAVPAEDALLKSKGIEPDHFNDALAPHIDRIAERNRDAMEKGAPQNLPPDLQAEHTAAGAKEGLNPGVEEKSAPAEKSSTPEWQAFAPESGTLGIPRAEMPQIKSEQRGALANFLRARGVDFTREEALPKDLKPTQAEFSPAKVEKAAKFEGEQRAILVSKDGHVVDGHHQWAAALRDHPDQPIPVIRLGANIREALAAVHDFPSTETAEGAKQEERAAAPAEKSPVKVLGYGPGDAAKQVARLVWGDGSVLKQDVKPTVADAAKGVAETADDIRRVFAPQTKGEQAAKMAGMAREHGAKLAQRVDQATHALAKARSALDRLPVPQRFEFIDRIETGRAQPTPELQGIADIMRDILKSKREEIRGLGTGKLQHFIEDYFPHIWEDPTKAEAAFRQAASKAPIQGAKSFLKKRSIPTIKEGMELGLKTVSENPVDLVLLKAREMDKYILGQRLLTEMKRKGLAKFVRATERAPEGYSKIEDSIASVYGPPTVKLKEHVDKAVMDGLRQTLDNIGVKHDRLQNAGKGRLGFSEQGGDRIVSQNATELGVIAHELGHQLDHKFGLGKILNRKSLEAETRALADLHGHSEDYFRTPEERVASVLEAYVQAKQRMQEIAPRTLKTLEAFIGKHAQLAPLKEIKPGLQMEKIDYEKPHGGLLKMGEYHAPDAAANVINNYLSPGLRAKSAAFRAYLGVSNFMNQAQLGLSFFHLGFTSLDATVSKFANALQYLTEGKLGTFLAETAKTPTAALTNLISGEKVLKEWFSPGSQGAEMAQIVDALRAAGGRAKMDEFYRTTVTQRMMQAFRSGNILGGLFRTPFAGLELAAKPIMEYIVPRQKMGVFADLARRELAKLPAGADRDQVRATMGKAWDSVENRMGQMTYDNLFWNKVAKDLSMASVRSLGWNLGTFREFGGAGIDLAKQLRKLGKWERPELTSRMAYVAALPIIAGTLGATMTYLMTGKGPQEMKDYFFPDTGEKDGDNKKIRLSLPSYMKDVFEYAHDPVTTLTNKLHPAVSSLVQMFNNKDYYGTEIRHPDDPLIKQALQEVEYVGKSLMPFGIRNLMKQSEDGTSAGVRAAGFFGFPKAPYYVDQTKAEATAADLARARLPQGSRTQEQTDKAQEKRDFALHLRSKDPAERDAALQEMHDKVRAGTMSPEEFKNIGEKARTPRLEYQVKHLPVEDAVKVYRVATPEERDQIRTEILKKVMNAKTLPISEKRNLVDLLRAPAKR